MKCEIIRDKSTNDGYLRTPDTWWAVALLHSILLPAAVGVLLKRSRDGPIGRDKTLQFLKDIAVIISQTRQANPILLPPDVWKPSPTTTTGSSGTDRPHTLCYTGRLCWVSDRVRQSVCMHVCGHVIDDQNAPADVYVNWGRLRLHCTREAQCYHLLSYWWVLIDPRGLLAAPLLSHTRYLLLNPTAVFTYKVNSHDYCYPNCPSDFSR